MSETILKEMKEVFNKTFADFRKENDEALAKKSALSDEKVDKLGKQLDTIEAEYKKLKLTMETKKDLSETEQKNLVYKGAFESYCKSGLEQMSVEQKNLLFSETKAKLIAGDATMGGYLLRPEFENSIIKNITEMDPMRQYARVTAISGRSLIYQKRKTLLTGKWTGEQGTTQKDASTYGQAEIATHGLTTCVPISDELLQDSFVNMETEMNMDAAEAFSYTENLAFTLGNNVTQPEGWLTNSDIEVIDTATSSVFVADDLIELMFSLKSAYVNGANFFGNRKQLATIRKFKGSDGQYLLNTGQTAGISYVLLGTPWVEMPSMTTTKAAGDKLVGYGDMFKTYRIIDRIGMSVLRDPYSNKLDGMVEFLFKKRVGGKVTLAESMKVLRVKA